MKYGYEIEANISNLNTLVSYLQRFGDSKKNRFGVDGVGISTIEVRSRPVGTIAELISDLVDSMVTLKEYKPRYDSFIVTRRGWRFYLTTNSVHLSLDSSYKIDEDKLRRFFYRVYPEWLFKRNKMAFLRFYLRKIFYREIYREHPERLELRFLSSEYPITSVLLFAEYFDLH